MAQSKYIVDFPNENDGSFQIYVAVYQRVGLWLF